MSREIFAGKEWEKQRREEAAKKNNHQKSNAKNQGRTRNRPPLRTA
jgi:hypothetical protein